MNSSHSTLPSGDTPGQNGRCQRKLLPPEWRQCIELGAPIMLTVWVNMGMSVTDTWMVSRLGSSAVAAVAVGSDLYSIVLYFFGGLLAGLMPPLAEATGRGDQRRVSELWSALWVACGIAMALAVPIVWFAPGYLSQLGLDSALLEQGCGYTRYVAMSVIPMLAVNVLRIVLTAYAKPKLLFNATLCALPLNALFNVVFIHGLGPVGAMGIDGAGLATFMTSCTVASLLVWQTKRELFAHGLIFRGSIVDLADLWNCLKIGTPIGVTILAEIGVYLGATLYLASVSSGAVASHTLALKLAGIAYAVPLALAQVATVRMAQAHDSAASRRVVITQLQMAAVSSVLLCVALAMAATPAAAILRDGTDVGERAAHIAWSLIWLLALTELIEPFSTTATGLLRGRNDTFVPMLISTASYWLLSVPLALWLAPRAESAAGAVWVCLLLGMLLSAVLLMWRLFTQQRMSDSGRDG